MARVLANGHFMARGDERILGDRVLHRVLARDGWLAQVFGLDALGLFLVAFFLKWIGGTAVFWAAIAAQALVFVLYANLQISYLWYNVIGCAACMAFSIILQAAVGLGRKRGAAAP